MSGSQVPKAPLTGGEKTSIALAEENAIRGLRERARRHWLRDDSFRRYSRLKELNLSKCVGDTRAHARVVFPKLVDLITAAAGHEPAPSLSANDEGSINWDAFCLMICGLLEQGVPLAAEGDLG